MESKHKWPLITSDSEWAKFEKHWKKLTNSQQIKFSIDNSDQFGVLIDSDQASISHKTFKTCDGVKDPDDDDYYNPFINFSEWYDILWDLWGVVGVDVRGYAGSWEVQDD